MGGGLGFAFYFLPNLSLLLNVRKALAARLSSDCVIIAIKAIKNDSRAIRDAHKAGYRLLDIYS